MLKHIKFDIFRKLNALADGGELSSLYHPNSHWWGSYPFNKLRGLDAIVSVWQQLRHAFPDIERRDNIFVGGISKPDDRMPDALSGRTLIAALGTYQGTFKHDLLGIPATHGLVHLRFAEVHYVIDGKIAHSYVMLDFLDLMRQAGVWPLVPSLGAEHIWPSPRTGDGVQLLACDPETGQAGFDIVMAMHAALGTFDGKDLDSMQHGQYWHENFLWYGPGGIGSTRGMEGFRAHHQIPFLTGFPDRQGSGHYVRIADGDYVVTGGWPSVVGTHGGEWLGLPATGKRIKMRVMDFYHLENGLIRENWVPIDVIHMLKQMGLDVFARLNHLRGHPKRSLF